MITGSNFSKFLVLFMVLFTLSSALHLTHESLTKAQREEIVNSFKHFDKNGDGEINQAVSHL